MTDSQSRAATDSRVLQLSPDDNIGVASTTIERGESLVVAGQEVVCNERVATGHKITLAPIAAGEKVLKYGAAIGSTTRDIRLGEWVHTHNLKSDYLPTYMRGEGG